jgi:hypothetical protein
MPFLCVSSRSPHRQANVNTEWRLIFCSSGWRMYVRSSRLPRPASMQPPEPINCLSLKNKVCRSRPHGLEVPFERFNLLWFRGKPGVIILRFLATRRPVCTAVAQNPVIHAIRFLMHQVPFRTLLDSDRDIDMPSKHPCGREPMEQRCFLLFLLVLPSVAINCYPRFRTPAFSPAV